MSCVPFSSAGHVKQTRPGGKRVKAVKAVDMNTQWRQWRHGGTGSSQVRWVRWGEVIIMVNLHEAQSSAECSPQTQLHGLKDFPLFFTAAENGNNF